MLLQVEISGGCDKPLPPVSVLLDVQMRSAVLASRQAHEGEASLHAPLTSLALKLVQVREARELKE